MIRYGGMPTRKPGFGRNTGIYNPTKRPGSPVASASPVSGGTAPMTPKPSGSAVQILAKQYATDRARQRTYQQKSQRDQLTAKHYAPNYGRMR